MGKRKSNAHHVAGVQFSNNEQAYRERQEARGPAPTVCVLCTRAIHRTADYRSCGDGHAHAPCVRRVQ